jgi:hypothetical protein
MVIRNTIVTVRHRPSGGMGRFGGGWEWKVGVQASRNCRSIIVSLLVFYVRITRPRFEGKVRS